MSDISNIPHIRESELPATYRAADQSSIEAQRNYLWLVRLDLLFIVVGAIATSWSIETVTGRTFLAIVGAVGLAISSFLTFILLVTKYDKTWFGTRAIAESTKTLAWRYMTKAETFGHELTEKNADELFCRKVEQILQERRNLGASLAGAAAAGDQITESMRFIRNQDMPIRKAIYLRDRIRNQQGWYAKKATSNKGSTNFWLIAISLCQLVAVVAAILLVKWPTFNLNFASILAAIAAAFLAWLQVKRHQDLVHSYGLAAHELGLILAREKHVSSNQELSLFVVDAENAISREHTMWLARRGTL
jgi:hypothetical protein